MGSCSSCSNLKEKDKKDGEHYSNDKTSLGTYMFIAIFLIILG